jgi:uncharacterized membrane protein YesL
MKLFFQQDGLFNKVGTMLADIVILGFFWFIINVLTLGIGFGAATTALYYVATKRLYNKEEYITKDFFKSFKENFVQGSIISLLIFIVAIVIVFNIVILNNYYSINSLGVWRVILVPMQYLMLFQLGLISVYIFPIMARFKMKNVQLIKTSVVMANKHVLTSITCIIAGFFVFLFCFIFPPFILVAMGVYVFISSHFIMKTIEKYRPELTQQDTNIN